MSTYSNGTRPSDQVTPEDHSEYVIITAAILIAWTILVFAMRIYIRFHISGNSSGYFGNDDTAFTLGTVRFLSLWAFLAYGKIADFPLAVSQVVSIAQTCVTFTAVHDGLGKASDILDSGQIEQSLKLTYAASLLYIIAICASKCSVSLLVSRITPLRHHRVASSSITLFSIAWGIAGLFVIAFACNRPKEWDTVVQNCPNLFIRWVVIEGMSLFIEIMLFVLSLYFAWDIHMSWNSKAVVVGAFSCRLLIIPPTILRLFYLRDAITGSDPTMDSVNSIITTQIVMHFSLMAATIPCMRPFLRAFDSGLGYSVRVQANTDGELSSKYVEDSSYVLQSVNSRNKESLSAGLRPDRAMTTTIAEHFPPQQGKDAAASIDSNDSHRMIIRKTQEWEVVNQEQK